MKTNKQKYSLYSALILIIISTVVIVTSVQSFTVYKGVIDEMHKDIENNSQITITTVVKNLSKSIEAYAVNEYSILILNEMAHIDFEAIVIEDYNMGKVLAKNSFISGKIRVDGHIGIVDFDPENIEHIEIINNSYHSVKEDIFGTSGNKIGTVTIYITDEFVKLEGVEIIKRAILNVIIVSLFLIIILFLVIRHFILKPITSIITTIDKTDKQGVPVNLLSTNNGSKEMISLSNRINKMISTIKTSNIELNNKKNELEIFNNNLEELVTLRTEELKQTQKRMVQTEKMAALGSLVAGVAHEINTPIGLGITGLSHFLSETTKLKELHENNQMTKDDFENYLDSSVEIAQISYKNLNRAADIVKSFKQISVDQTNEQARRFNLKDYIEDILKSLNNKIKHTKIDVKLNCPSDLVIFSYPGALSQVLTNMIINSLIHGYDKGEKGIINIDVEEKDSVLRLVYRDDGKGISKENIVKIFDPFFTTNRTGGGSGLGLNIIHNIVVELLKGTIECKSENMQGTEFIIVIPIEQKGEVGYAKR